MDEMREQEIKRQKHNGDNDSNDNGENNTTTSGTKKSQKKIRTNNMQHNGEYRCDGYRNVIAFRPTGWAGNKPYQTDHFHQKHGQITIHHVPYSVLLFHSYLECHRLSSFILN